MRKQETFDICIDSQPIIVTYTHDYIPRCLAMLEYSTSEQPRKPTPVSRTGYCCQFIYHEEIKEVRDIKDYACQRYHIAQGRAKYR